MSVWYNENAAYPAQWLRNLVAAGHLPAGIVDERSVRDVRPDELRGHAQCHFFAGIGGWPLALRLAGWPDELPVWTGSCPCQPWSCAGKRRGADDERHLWPAWRRLIATCLPTILFGEQVAGPDAMEWLDGVAFDLEHIRFFTRFYEDLHEVQEAAKDNLLSQICWEVIRRAASDLQRLPARVRGGLESAQQGTPGQGARQKSRQGESLSRAVRRPASRATVSKRSATASGKTWSSIRSRRSPGGSGSTDAEGGLRGDWHSARHALSWYQMELPVVAPEESKRGVRVQEYADCVLCGQRGAWYMGRRNPAEGHMCVGAEIANDQRKLADAFREVLASLDGMHWLDLVSADLEAAGYAVGAADLAAASVGAPHIRQRLYFVAYRQDQRCDAWRDGEPRNRAQEQPRGCSDALSMADADDDRREEQCATLLHDQGSQRNDVARRCSPGGMGHADSGRARKHAGELPGDEGEHAQRSALGDHCAVAAGAVGGSWADAEWIHCSDGKWRPAQPGAFPLAARLPGDVGRLRAYGNAIVPPLAATFVRAAMGAMKEFG